MRRVGPRVWIGVAALAIAGGAAAWWWQAARPSTVTVRIFPDFAYRSRPDWKAVLESRMAQVARIYSSQTGVRWKLAGIETEDPINGASGPIDARRAALAANNSYQADVLLIVTGVHEGARGGSVSPFSHAALVVDFPDRSEQFNVLNTAHELAHLFGVANDTTPGNSGAGTAKASPATAGLAKASLMAAEPADSRFSRSAATLIDSVRGFPFRAGVSAITGTWEPRLARALVDANQGLFPNPRSRAWQILAASEALDGLYDPAIRHLREAVREDPANPAVRIQLAAALIHTSDADAAINTLREGLKLAPGNIQVHAMLAAALSRRDREAAMEEYRAAIRLAPSNAELHEAMGALFQTGGQIDSAIAAFRDAGRLDPQNRRIQAELAGAQTAKAQAIADATRLRAAAGTARTDANAFYRLGLAEARAGNYDAAAKALNRAIELNPQSGPSHVSLALVYYIRGAYAEASAEMARAQALGAQPPADFAVDIQRHGGR